MSEGFLKFSVEESEHGEELTLFGSWSGDLEAAVDCDPYADASPTMADVPDGEWVDDKIASRRSLGPVNGDGCDSSIRHRAVVVLAVSMFGYFVENPVFSIKEYRSSERGNLANVSIYATILEFRVCLFCESFTMNPGMQRPSDIPPPSIVPVQGLHCGHYFYRWNRFALQQIGETDRTTGRLQFASSLQPVADLRPERIQTAIVSGHKADFCLVMMDSDPLKIDSVHQRLMSGLLGTAIEPTYSFVSMSEVSEYLPTAESYTDRLIKAGEDPTTPAFQAKVAAYSKRLPIMLQQRLAPEFPDWPAMCFYPMNKSRLVGANWFSLPYSERSELMSEHAQSGMAFAGKVTQLVTASVGLDDWEWGVTLWAKNPQYLKDIVYTMRYDRASARYGEFGPFYTGYVSSPEKILEHCFV